jgi:DNA (cytosine-5)-methyltransferase 1
MKTVLSLFSGCGGMDLGFEGGFSVHKSSINRRIHKVRVTKSSGEWIKLPKNEFSIVFANDILREAKAAYVPFFSKRGSTHPFYSDSIVDLVKKAKEKSFNFPHADVVIGGFPCQDFSLAGKRLGFNSSKSHTGQRYIDIPNEENRGTLYIWMKKVIEIVKPKVFIAENVKGLASLGEVKKIIENDFRNIGKGYYVLDAKILHAANYGVPQTRERVIFIGFNKKYLSKKTLNALETGLIDPYPPKTHNLPGENYDNLEEYVSLLNVLKDLPEPDEAKDLAQKEFSKAKYYGKHVQGQIEVDLNSLGPTIRAEHHGNIEFRRLPLEYGGRYKEEIINGKSPRRLTVRECARIQTFPDDYQFIRSKSELGEDFTLSPSSAYKVIGNAVPPLLAYNIAFQLQNIWDIIFSEDI